MQSLLLAMPSACGMCHPRNHSDLTQPAPPDVSLLWEGPERVIMAQVVGTASGEWGQCRHIAPPGVLLQVPGGCQKEGGLCATSSVAPGCHVSHPVLFLQLCRLPLLRGNQRRVPLLETWCWVTMAAVVGWGA